MTQPARFQLRRNTAAGAAASNPTPAAGELGVETDTLNAKVCDGATAWNSLPYAWVKAATQLGAYRTVADRGGEMAASAAATRIFLPDGIVTQGAGNSARAFFYFDPADYAVPPLTLKCRVRFSLDSSTVDPGQTFTAGLYPTSGTATAFTALAQAVGTVTTGSTVALTPGASAIVAGTSADFTAPAAGLYALGLVVPSAMAANSACIVRLALQVHHV